MLFPILQSKCFAGPQQFPPLVVPPTSVGPDVMFAPAPSPSESGGAPMDGPHSSVVPASGSVIAFPPSGGPSGSASSACLLNPLASFPIAILLYLCVKYVISLPL